MDVTRNKRARIAALGIAAALSLAALSGCSPSSSGTSADGDVLTVAASAAVTTWDPVASFSTEALYMGNLYEPLLWKNPEGSAKAFTPAIGTWTKFRSGILRTI